MKEFKINFLNLLKFNQVLQENIRNQNLKKSNSLKILNNLQLALIKAMLLRYNYQNKRFNLLKNKYKKFKQIKKVYKKKMKDFSRHLINNSFFNRHYKPLPKTLAADRCLLINIKEPKKKY